MGNEKYLNYYIETSLSPATPFTIRAVRYFDG